MNRKAWLRTAQYALLIFLSVIFLFPTVWMVAASLRPEIAVLAHSGSWRAFLPIPFTVENYVDLFRRGQFGRYIWNSTVQTGLIVALGLVVNSFFGYALARQRFRGRRVLLAAVVALIVIPFEATVIPLYLLVSRLGWIDTYAGLVVPFVANAFSIYLFYSFFLSVPRELEEAAAIDGAGPFTTFFRVVVPVAKPAYATAAILTFLQYWNDFLWPYLVTTGPRRRTVQVGLQAFFTDPPIQWGDVMAATVVATIPVLLFFLFFQRYFIEGIARSGIKG